MTNQNLFKQTFTPFFVAAMLMVGSMSLHSDNSVHNALGFNTTSDPAGMATKSKSQQNKILL